jgi:hypothetical protein
MNISPAHIAPDAVQNRTTGQPKATCLSEREVRCSPRLRDQRASHAGMRTRVARRDANTRP